MKLGLQLPSFTFPGGPDHIAPTIRDIATYADTHGFYSLWVMDHWFQMEYLGGAEAEMLEGYSTLSYLAALTEHVKLGTLVTGVIYRYPGLLVKTATTLDVLSGGRAYFGVGAAWYEREARGLGVPYPPTAERFERLEETLQIALQMWSGEVKPYHGQHYHLEEAMNHPNAIRQPHPPIMVGGMGEQKTLRLVAQYADACNLFMRAGVDTLSQKLDALKAHCDAVGRPYEAIEKTALGTIVPGKQSAAEIVDLCRSVASLGFTHAIFNMPNVYEPGALRLVAEQVIPEVAAF
ncbi:MAG: LLM class F420-dependent oxidoreductase [Anaerolineae bacterium]